MNFMGKILDGHLTNRLLRVSNNPLPTGCGLVREILEHV